MMRSEKQMMDLIMNTARNDERIRAVIMNGSRANPNAKRDIFQDYDIVYIVEDVSSFTANHSWVDIFGDMMIMQMPKSMTLIPDAADGSFTYLMQFKDGNRIDLWLVPKSKVQQLIARESQSILLLDKDGIIEPFPPASDADFIIKRPDEKLFLDCCNEFWWICNYVAKGIWRDELPYAMHMLDRYARDMLDEVVQWHIGIKTNFSVSAGKCGKYFKTYLEQEIWELYKKTYSDSDYEHLWHALFTMCHLFRRLAEEVSCYFGFSYPHEEDRNVMAHLLHVKQLPPDAEQMY